MDKNLIVPRNMSKDIKGYARKSSNNLVNERHQSHAVNAKNYHTQHNYFHRTPHKNSSGKKHFAPLSDSVSLSNEEYIHANAQIWLNQDSLKSNYDYNDIYSQWDSIIQINFYTNEEILCPICLNIPTIGRSDKCGHIYCLPCLNKFLSYDNGFYSKCALCNQEIDKSRMKRASFIERFPLKVGDEMSMLLMKRNKCESFSVPIDHSVPSIPYAYSNESRFSTVAICANDDLLSIVRLEMMSLEDQLSEAIREECENTVSIEQALEAVKIDYELASHYPSISKPLVIDPIPMSVDHMKSIMKTDNVYYQAEDGSNVFMCPLNWKCLTHEFIDNGQSLPLRICGLIVDIERFIVTHDFINRYRYLRYLPIGSSVSFVELDLGHIMSPSTLAKFDRELQKRSENRAIKHRMDQVLTREKIKHENSFNSSTGFICLNSLMKETDNIIDRDFIPLPSPSSQAGSTENSAKSSSDKPMSFADMIHATNMQSLSRTLITGQPKQNDDNQNRGFSLQDCIIKKTKKKSKK